MECSCTINSSCGDEAYEDNEEKTLTNISKTVNIKCGECGREIKFNEKFEWYRGEYDGEKYTHHTCIDCLSLRDNFFGDWVFERLWDDFECHMDDCDWQIPEKCLSKVTPITRSKICEMIERKWLAEAE